MTDDDALGHAAPLEQGREAHADGIEAHEVDFFREQPARVVFAKPCRLDEREALKIGGVGFQIGAWLRQHGAPSGQAAASFHVWNAARISVW